MNASARTVYLSSTSTVATLRELDAVRLTADVTDDEGRVIRAGTHGTIVAVWGEGAAYEVDFSEPVDTNATVEAENLESLAAR